MTEHATPVIGQFSGRYRFLSNFYFSPFPATMLGSERIFPTAEHAFQGAKVLACGSWARANKIRWLDDLLANSSAGAAKRAGKRIPIDLDVWTPLSIPVMATVLATKFKDPYLRGLLTSTGDAVLIEGNDWGDRLWGQSGGKGRNLLGKMLMVERDRIFETS